jgi:hypothetical protein
MKRRLGRDGVLRGYTILAGKSLSHHEYEYKSKEELARILKQHFARVLVSENVSNDQFEQRHNLYFYASDGHLLFNPAWPNMLRFLKAGR